MPRRLPLVFRLEQKHHLHLAPFAGRRKAFAIFAETGVGEPGEVRDAGGTEPAFAPPRLRRCRGTGRLTGRPDEAIRGKVDQDVVVGPFPLAFGPAVDGPGCPTVGSQMREAGIPAARRQESAAGAGPRRSAREPPLELEPKLALGPRGDLAGEEKLGEGPVRRRRLGESKIPDRDRDPVGQEERSSDLAESEAVPPGEGRLERRILGEKDAAAGEGVPLPPDDRRPEDAARAVRPSKRDHAGEGSPVVAEADVDPVDVGRRGPLGGRGGGTDREEGSGRRGRGGRPAAGGEKGEEESRAQQPSAQASVSRKGAGRSRAHRIDGSRRRTSPSMLPRAGRADAPVSPRAGGSGHLPALRRIPTTTGVTPFSTNWTPITPVRSERIFSEARRPSSPMTATSRGAERRTR